jgi:hypothetical protein
MAKRSVPINTRPARVALRQLLIQLKRADLSELKTLANPKGMTKTARSWVSLLETAEREIPEWCPNKRGDDQFSFDLPPASRRRRR